MCIAVGSRGATAPAKGPDDAALRDDRDDVECASALCLDAGAAGALALPVLVTAPPPRAAWPFVGASVLAETLYIVTLARAYARADFSVAYPLARGLAPVLLAGWSVLFLDERPEPAAWGGIASVAIGILILGADAQRDTRAETNSAGGGAVGLAAAVACALCISAYSAIDAAAMRHGGGAGYQTGYVAAVFALTAVLLLAGFALRLRITASERGSARRPDRYRASLAPALLVGGGMLVAYGLTAVAYARASATAVGAAREVSIAFAALGGGWRFHERLSPLRVAGVTLIVVGVVSCLSSVPRRAGFGTRSLSVSFMTTPTAQSRRA